VKSTINAENHARFLKDMVALQLWYVIRVVRSGQADFIETLNRCTQIYAFSTGSIGNLPVDKNPKWLEVTEELQKRWRELGDEKFLTSFWPYLESHIRPGIPMDLNREEEALQQSHYGFSYEYHPEYFGPKEPEFLTLHFRNFFVSDSPFHHRSELIAGLIQVLDKVSEENRKVDHVQCGTWLNGFNPFLDLFPESWRQSARDVPMDGSFGWWGQFVDRTGQLHASNVAAFKSTKEFLYPNRVCTCGVEELRQHLVSAAEGE
jgi:hypothetical protein